MSQNVNSNITVIYILNESMHPKLPIFPIQSEIEMFSMHDPEVQIQSKIKFSQMQCWFFNPWSSYKNLQQRRSLDASAVHSLHLMSDICIKFVLYLSDIFVLYWLWQQTRFGDA